MNPVAMAALQAAQWAAAASAYSGASSVVSAPPSQHQQVLHSAAASISLANAGTSSTTPKWPPNFDTNGGSYVFQPKSGCFLDQSSGFYYDPKSRLYYSALNGAYYSYDSSAGATAAGEARFKRFFPTAPTDLDDGTSATTLLSSSAAGTTTATTSFGMSIKKAPTGKVTSKQPGTLLGMSGLGAKKALKDIGKWEAVNSNAASDDDEEQQRRGGGSTAAVVTAASKMLKVSADDAAAAARLKAAADALGSFPSSARAGRAIGVDATAVTVAALSNSATVASAHTVGAAHTLSASFTNAQLENLLSSTTAASTGSTTSTTTGGGGGVRSTAAVSGATATAAPTEVACCLLCRRQFASLDMLQRHERESKLHAENVKLAATKNK
jgi:hypothetical protein